jgi:hypothetical protein
MLEGPDCPAAVAGSARGCRTIVDEARRWSHRGGDEGRMRAESGRRRATGGHHNGRMVTGKDVDWLGACLRGRPLRGAALEFACWVAQLRQIGVIVSPRGPKLEQLPRQGPLRCCLPSRSHLKLPLAKPPPYEYANYHQHGRHRGSDRSRSHSVAPLASGRPEGTPVALDGPAPARAGPTVGCAQLPHLTWQ